MRRLKSAGGPLYSLVQCLLSRAPVSPRDIERESETKVNEGRGVKRERKVLMRVEL